MVRGVMGGVQFIHQDTDMQGKVRVSMHGRPAHVIGILCLCTDEIHPKPALHSHLR